MSIASFDHVSKIYRIGQGRSSLREEIGRGVGRLLGRRARDDSQIFHALNDVSFDLNQGDVLGIIGHNGAGKSTSLKLLAGITQPDQGKVNAHGRIAAMIELGAGFHPELTGRQNIFLNASFMGMSNRETSQVLDSIIDFSGLERFIDTPVKRYSSGMYVRLAFSVAAHVNAELMLIDEVLSVGDAAFQRRCIDKMTALRNAGTTLVLVTHNLWTIESFCNRALLLHSGALEIDGTPAEVLERYRRYEQIDLLSNANIGIGVDDGAAQPADEAGMQDGPIASIAVFMRDNAGLVTHDIDSWGTLDVTVKCASREPLPSAAVVVRIRRADGVSCCAVNTVRQHDELGGIRAGLNTFTVQFSQLPLVPGQYSVEAHLIDIDRPLLYASSERMPFMVNGELVDADAAGVFYPEHAWQVTKPA